MGLEKQGQRKAVIDKTDKALVITAPSNKSISFIVFLFAAFWLWVLGQRIIIDLIVGISVLEGYGYFFLFWFVAWSFLGLMIVLKFLWVLTGKEVVTVSSDTLKLDKVYLGVRKSKEYCLDSIKELRLEKPLFFRRQKGILFNFFFKGFLKFDYGVNTVTFMSSVDEDEAAYILEQIKNYLEK